MIDMRWVVWDLEDNDYAAWYMSFDTAVYAASMLNNGKRIPRYTVKFFALNL